jgi:hypothetical protein
MITFLGIVSCPPDAPSRTYRYSIECCVAQHCKYTMLYAITSE